MMLLARIVQLQAMEGNGDKVAAATNVADGKYNVE
jgi:hypothetical protein